MTYTQLEERIDTLNKNIDHLKILAVSNYDCSKEEFRKEIKAFVFQLINEMVYLEEIVDEDLDFYENCGFDLTELLNI